MSTNTESVTPTATADTPNGTPVNCLGTFPPVPWATDRQVEEGVRWSRKAETAVAAKSEKLANPPEPVLVEAYQCDWLSLDQSSGLVKYERESDVEVIVGNYTFSLAEARYLAQALTEVCNAVDGQS